MKKYNVQNYIRYKEDVKASMPDEEFDYIELPRDKLIVKFLPLVENLARKFSTTQQASGVLSINDLLQIGAEGLTKAVDKLDWNMLGESEDIEKTLKSFFSKRIKGAMRRRPQNSGITKWTIFTMLTWATANGSMSICV